MCVCVCVCVYIYLQGGVTCELKYCHITSTHVPCPFLLYKFRVGGGVVELKTTAVLIATLLFSWDLCSARTDV